MLKKVFLYSRFFQNEQQKASLDKDMVYRIRLGTKQVEDFYLYSLHVQFLEYILALKSSIEGETTTLYIKTIFQKKPVTISRLSYGLPMGAEIEYLDMMTLDKALFDRKIISE